MYDLTFAEFGDLTVSVRRPSERGWELLADAIEVLGEGLDSAAAPVVERVRAGGWLVRAFADALIGWDLRDRGRAVPATLAGVLAQDRPFLLVVARTWYTAVVLRPEENSTAGMQTRALVDDERDDADAEQRLMGLPVMVAPEPILETDDRDDVVLVGAGVP